MTAVLWQSLNLLIFRPRLANIFLWFAIWSNNFFKLLHRVIITYSTFGRSSWNSTFDFIRRALNIDVRFLWKHMLIAHRVLILCQKHSMFIFWRPEIFRFNGPEVVLISDLLLYVHFINRLLFYLFSDIKCFLRAWTHLWLSRQVWWVVQVGVHFYAGPKH